MTKPTIYLDCDGVLADFDGYFEHHWGMPCADFEERYGTTQFWNQIESHEGFFEQLGLMPDAAYLYEGVKHLNPTILTGIPKGGWATPQKMAWAAKHFPGVPVITCPSARKSRYCQPGDVIIDDTPKHRAKWIAAGGIWIDHKEAVSSLDALWAHYPDLRPVAAAEAERAKILREIQAEAERYPNTDWALSLNAVAYFLNGDGPADAEDIPIYESDYPKSILIDRIIDAYHTTRMSSTPVAQHILSKPYVQRAFAALGQ